MAYDSKTNNRFKQSIYQQQIEQLYHSLVMAMLASVVMALFLGWALHLSLPPKELHYWIIAYLLLTLFSITCSFSFHKKRYLFSDRNWEKIYLALTVAATLMWASVIVWMFPQADSAQQALIILLIAGLHMGAATSLSFRLTPILIFVGTTATLLMWQLSLHPEWFSLIAIGLYAVILPIVLVTAQRNYKNNYHSHLHGLQAKRKSELLKRSEQRFLSIINSAGEILLIHNPKGKIIDVNRRACELLGYKDQRQLLGSKINQIAGEASEIYHNLLRVMSDGEPMIYETKYLRQDGSELPVEACITNYDDPTEGESVLVLARDLSAKQAEQQELNESRQKLDLHIQSTPLAVIDWDTSFNVKSWNPAAKNIFGYHADEIIGKNGIEHLLIDEYRAKAQEMFQELINNRGDNRITIQNLTKNRQRIYCEWINTALIDPHGKALGVASLVMDVTDRIEAEKALKKAMQNERAANSAKSEFLSRMSHELRTPLNAIIGLSQLLQFDDKLDDEQLDYIDDIRHAGNHLLTLVNEVLDLSRIEQGKIELDEKPESYHELMQASIQLMEPLIQQQQLTFQYNPKLDDFYLLVDRHRFVQVMGNLLSNAVKYSRKNGLIRIHEQQLSNGRLKITVEDNGIGIKRERQRHIFEPFQRAGAEYSEVEGSGLGLMLSKQVIERMGGNIGFESEEGKGSLFWITLPSKAAALLNNK